MVNKDDKNMESDFNTDTIRNRLDEIKDILDKENLDLDKSLELYEEAVKLGLEATNKIEDNISEFVKIDDTNENSDIE